MKDGIMGDDAGFRCTARIWTGPGHQSDHPCTHKEPHSLDGDHWITEVIYEWNGPEAFAG